MPSRPFYPCKSPGCGELVTEPGMCAKHKKPSGWSRAAKDPKRYGYGWTKIRSVAMRRDGGLCQMCLKADRVTMASEVDHITPVEHGGTDDLENLQSLCRDCHKMKTAYESAEGRAQAMPEWLPKPRIPVIVVCGPPGSGKTTYVQKHASPRDLVLDVDVIASQLSNKPLYEAPIEDVIKALRVRNKLIASLAGPTDYERLWLIVAANRESKREWWKQKLGAELVVLDVDKRTCLSRIEADPCRSASAKAKARRGALDWC